ncbi:erythromycin esterase family protein [Saccharothrix syringae]|uniref:Erythromycin esterase family protein n=1 Tax=Saccharothrix syringae TaxID=103733 RepID=A0A5Q0GYM4_SACSY|nr:erythromycin esterase family protein [Saccharothrix syringae]QFZ18963.1 erythromycin esterase family protein [Saccharothrix syringae]
MTVPLISVAGDDHRTLVEAVAAQFPTPPRVLGFGEPVHGEDEFAHLRNALFEVLVERLGFTSIALETSAWEGRVVDAYVRGGDGDEDEVMATGFTHGFGGSPANRALVRWLREQNRHRPRERHLRFAAFDAPVEMAAAPSPRAALRSLHDFLGAHADVPPWEDLDRLLGPDEPWSDPAAAMDPARSVGAEPGVRELGAITDDLRWTLAAEVPRLRREVDPDELDDALLAARTATGLLAYHRTMARDTGHRWHRLAAVRDTMMADNLQAIAERGPTLVFAHNQHLRAGTTSLSFPPQFGSTTLRWQPAGAHLADRLGEDYRVIACALGEAAHQEIPEPEPDTVEGVLHRDLPPGNHLLAAPAVHALQRGLAARKSPTYRYIPLDETILGQVDQLLFLRAIEADRRS